MAQQRTDSGHENSTVSSSSSSSSSSGLKRARQAENSSKSGTKHPNYRGVRMRSWGKWVSEIRQPRKKARIWLGTYPTAEMAARAHDVASITIKGDSAVLNFPHLADSLPQPASSSPEDVRAAAAKAAAMEEGLVSAVAEDDELGEIIELPELGIDGGGLVDWTTPEEKESEYFWNCFNTCDNYDGGLGIIFSSLI